MTGLLLRGASSSGFDTAVGLAFDPGLGGGNRHAKLIIVNESCTKLVLRGASGNLILSRIRYLETSGKGPRRIETSIPLSRGAICLGMHFDYSKGGVGDDRNKRSLVTVYGFDCDLSKGGFRSFNTPFQTERKR